MHFHSLFQNFGELTVTGLAQGAIYALFALGYTMVYGVLRLINFAHSEVFMVGTFAAVLTWGLFGLDQDSATPSVGAVLLLLLAGFLAAALAAGIMALIVEMVAYRPLRRRNAPPLVFLITAIGASTVISEAVGIGTHRNVSSVPPLIRPSTVVQIGNTSVTNIQILIVGLALVMMVVLDLFIGKTRLGRGVRAVAQDPDSAALMGVNKNRVISLVFLTGGLMAGIAAVMYLLKIGGTRYDAGFHLGIKAFTAAVLGGIGNLRGALLGGLALGLAENYGSGLFGTQWRDVVAFVLLVVILLFRPTGILGESMGRARA
ncbi:MAG: branched-chain amino acid ABC transporter permease [Dactylosporangium sp.]|nr:branched-chain amino acid ABC transporter permease [Dactylosporangium sp.]NNJ59816.1 branched-chain amino acid ABC transporter permease [Dactylosporangium sp.]